MHATREIELVQQINIAVDSISGYFPAIQFCMFAPPAPFCTLKPAVMLSSNVSSYLFSLSFTFHMLNSSPHFLHNYFPLLLSLFSNPLLSWSLLTGSGGFSVRVQSINSVSLFYFFTSLTSSFSAMCLSLSLTVT